MSSGLAGIFAEAAALWRGDRDLWIRVAAVFYFLPMLALLFFASEPPAGDPDIAPEAAMQAALDWLAANAGWFAGAWLVQALGSCVLLALLLDPARPSLGQALGRAPRLLPGFLLVRLMTLLLVAAGSFAFLLPGLYAAGRTLVAGASYIAEPERGPFAAFVAGIRRTDRRGWMLLLAGMTLVAIYFVADMLLGSVGTLLGASGAASPFVRAPFVLVSAFVGAAMGLAQVLVEAAAYRRLAAPRQGI